MPVGAGAGNCDESSSPCVSVDGPPPGTESDRNLQVTDRRVPLVCETSRPRCRPAMPGRRSRPGVRRKSSASRQRTLAGVRRPTVEMRGRQVPFDPVEVHPSFVDMEERVLRRWSERDVVRRSLSAGGPEAPLLRCYEGPPTANGRPGVHHVEARVFKDVFPRFFAMKGYRIPRRAGWDCHGIPVEIEVEKQLGIASKPEIERFGVAEFNERCRQSVTGYVGEWERLTHRIGYWVDTDNPYQTMDTSYVESVWWSLKTIFDRGLLYEDHRIVPYCTRCGTTLSSHEVAQGYADTKDLSVYTRLPLLSGPLAPGGSGVDGDLAGASLLVWTTMPWTVIFSSLAVVGKDIHYVLARGGRAGAHLVVLAAERVEPVLGPDAEVLRDVALDEILGARYRGPYEYVGPGSPDDPDGDPASWRYVVLGDFVSTSTGSGIVSTAPAYGEDDMRVAKENGVTVINGVGTDGHLDDRIGPFAGMYIRDATERVVDDLRERGLAVHTEMYQHSFPFCWRCDTPLVYYAKLCWFIGTTSYRNQLIDGNAEVDWRPEHIRTGRYGDWLANNVDWAVSRERYWGTPLPLWRCQGCAHTIAVGSLAELGERAGQELSTLDPHRPYVDDVEFGCPSCASGVMHRVPEVIDAWYDSGSMPFAQHGYPHVPGSAEAFKELFPADLTAEAIDQTRGWWYSLQTVSTLLFGESSYRRALCLGHIVDESGRKMSKSVGNVLDPWTLIGTHGADSLRWLLLVEGNPWQSRRVWDEGIQQVTRKLLMTVWNTYYFLVTYANLSGWSPDLPAPDLMRRPVMDQYVLADLADAVSEVDSAMSNFDVTRAGKRIGLFVEDLSNWYVRRTRERFYHGEPGVELSEDTRAAFATLHTCVTTLAGLLAPFTPFLADEIHENLVRRGPDGPADSVHLAPFPVADTNAVDPGLRTAMSLARRLVTLGRDARNTASVPVRVPLRRAILTIPADLRDHIGLVRDVVAAELNVKEISQADKESGHLVTYTVKPDFRALGRLFGKQTQQVATALRTLDGEDVLSAMAAGAELTVVIGGADGAAGETVAVPADAVRVLEEPIAGWQVSSDGDCHVALDVTLDQELKLEGLAREFVRMLNELRKRRGYQIADKVHLGVSVAVDPGGELASMLRLHPEEITGGVRAPRMRDEVDPQSAERISIGDGELLVDLRVLAEH
ncbi:isoleucine--tRNA ligase [Solihabitans fulvus]|uniref:Isoleucine--tRNA ligase n=1 Tax=Solihabitans fulvus TaxID=1892852 RepID=A0A5B2WPX2_9PSEU|nr:isoleucine--tRNA ligase [Solihabitans fulvus]KAA2252830.1 isoleucine--tRNA ligase [Solihabitans fulvus]